MAHPNDIKADGTCRVCGDRLSAEIKKKNGKLVFRRHLSNNNCTKTQGKGQPVSN